MPDVGETAVELLHELVAIDSVNPGLVPGAAGETRVVEHLRVRLEGAGFVTTVVPGGGRTDRPSLVAVPPPVPDAAPTVLLYGHLDTVGVTGMERPFEPRVEGDRLLGRGAADMKGGVAAIVAAAERLVAVRAPVRPVLVLVADEEDASLGSEAVIEALPGLGVAPDVCVVAEPTDLARCRSLRGFGVVRVELTGRAAHSSQPELGHNAVISLGRLLRAVEERGRELQETGGDLMATLVSGGESAFVVPASATCVVEQRTGPDRPGADALAEVEALLEPAWRASAELVAHRDGWRLQDAGPAADLAERLAAALGGGPGSEGDFEAPYWMEAALWERVCPTLVCGPSGGGLHAVDEWVDLRQVRAYAEALVEVWSHAH